MRSHVNQRSIHIVFTTVLVYTVGSCWKHLRELYAMRSDEQSLEAIQGDVSKQQSISIVFTIVTSYTAGSFLFVLN